MRSDDSYDDWFCVKYNMYTESLRDHDKVLCVEFIVPGFLQDQLSLTFENRQLILIGKLQSDYIDKKVTEFIMEYKIKDFKSTIDISYDIDSSKITSCLSNGILKVSLPVVGAHCVTKIKINYA